MATTFKIKRKTFGMISAVGNLWKSGAMGKAAVVGGGAVATGLGAGAIAGGKYLKDSKNALEGNMGKENGAGY